MILFDGRAVYPLGRGRIEARGQRIYDRDTRGRSWFILEYCSVAPIFTAYSGVRFVSLDGKQIQAKERRCI